MNETEIPKGYKADAKGNLVPIKLIKPIDIQRDELVNALIQEAKKIGRNLKAFKSDVLFLIDGFVTQSGEQYGVHIGGKKGNITLHNFDGSFKIQVAISEHLVFDERLQAAKKLIDECIAEWSKGSRAEIKVLVQSAFQTDKEGKINTGRVLGLRRLDIQHEKWQQAMQAIGDSLQVIGSKEYIRFYERIADTDQYQPISLDVATA